MSGAMAFIGNETWFYVVRFLLGAAEAGFFPGMIFYLTLWFPAAYRGRVIGYFMAAIPLSTVIGAPISSALLGLDGVLGMHGWQWLFILEAAPALLLSVVALFYLTDKPADAGWLRDDERSWLVDRGSRGAAARGGATLCRTAGFTEPTSPGAQPGLFRRRCGHWKLYQWSAGAGRSRHSGIGDCALAPP
jgi:MFS family permease